MMERHQILDPMGELKLTGMRHAWLPTRSDVRAVPLIVESIVK